MEGAGMESCATRADKFWNIRNTLSHNCLFNFIISMRGGGKTYGCLKYCVEKYLKEKRAGRKWQFVYVRRQENELKKLTISRGGRLFAAVQKEFPDHVRKQNLIHFIVMVRYADMRFSYRLHSLKNQMLFLMCR